jgi:hypothetical protein
MFGPNSFKSAFALASLSPVWMSVCMDLRTWSEVRTWGGASSPAGGDEDGGTLSLSSGMEAWLVGSVERRPMAVFSESMVGDAMDCLLVAAIVCWGVVVGWLMLLIEKRCQG